MKILIVTPIHPLQIVEMNYLYKFYGNSCEVFSPQAMALLYEETFGQPYPVVNATFVDTCRRNKRMFYKNNKKHLIVYGNIDKNSPITFDHIISYTSHVSENEHWDPYLAAAEKALADTDAPKIDWYGVDDTTYTFPTIPHLTLFLHTLGISPEGEEEDATIQSTPTESD